MARTGRPKADLNLTDGERATLQRWARRAKSSQALALRARIMLACVGNDDNKQVAAAIGVHQDTVGKWRSRFIQRRLDGLADKDWPGGRRRSPTSRSRAWSWRRWRTRRRTRRAGRGHRWQEIRALGVHDRAGLEGVQARAAPGGRFQGEHRSAVHRVGPRCGRAVPEPARARGRALRRRKIALISPSMYLPACCAGSHRAKWAASMPTSSFRFAQASWTPAIAAAAAPRSESATRR